MINFIQNKEKLSSVRSKLNEVIAWINDWVGGGTPNEFFLGDGSWSPITDLGKNLLDDTSGAQMFATMGATKSQSSTSGTAKMPNGKLFQYGSAWVTTNPTGGVAITLPTAFSDTNYRVVACNGGAGVGAFNISVFVDYKTTGSFSVQVNRTTDGSAATSTSVRIDYIAIGEAP